MAATVRRRIAGILGAVICTTMLARVAAQQEARPVNERGLANAPITIVEFCTYASERCSRFDVVLNVVLPELGDRVRFVFRHVAADDTPAATLRYRAALAAGEQGHFWEMHDILMANRDRATPEGILGMIRQLGLDETRFRADLDSDQTRAAAKRDADEAAAQNITLTPTIVINGRALTGLKNAKELRAAIPR